MPMPAWSLIDNLAEWSTLDQAVEWIAWNVPPQPSHIAALRQTVFADVEFRQGPEGQRTRQKAEVMFVAYLAEGALQAEGRPHRSNAPTEIDLSLGWRHAAYEPHYVNIPAEAWQKRNKVRCDDSFLLTHDVDVEFPNCGPGSRSWQSIRVRTTDLLKAFPPPDQAVAHASSPGTAQIMVTTAPHDHTIRSEDEQRGVDASAADNDRTPGATAGLPAKRRGPKPGTVKRFDSADRALFQEIERLMKEEQTLTKVTKQLADEGKIAGVGSPASRAKRLARAFQKDVKTR